MKGHRMWPRIWWHFLKTIQFQRSSTIRDWRGGGWSSWSVTSDLHPHFAESLGLLCYWLQLRTYHVFIAECRLYRYPDGLYVDRSGCCLSVKAIAQILCPSWSTQSGSLILYRRTLDTDSFKPGIDPLFHFQSNVSVYLPNLTLSSNCPLEERDC
jgi:hypothetical protein